MRIVKTKFSIYLYNGKSVKVCGWLVNENDKITITGDSLYVLGKAYWGFQLSYTPEIQAFIETQDLTRKCYLKGELQLEKLMDGKSTFCCQFFATRVILKNLDDIYFE